MNGMLYPFPHVSRSGDSSDTLSVKIMGECREKSLNEPLIFCSKIQSTGLYVTLRYYRITN